MTTADPAVGRGRWSPRLDTSFHVLLALLLAMLAAMLVWRPLLPGYYDFWVHAGIGRWICQTGHVPDQTLFLWTASEPYVYHSWLAEVVLYGLTVLGGPEHTAVAALTFAALVVVLCFGLVWLTGWRCGRLSTLLAVALALAIQGTYHRFQVRPELFSSLLLCVLLAFLVPGAAAPAATPAFQAPRAGGGWRFALVAAGIGLLFALWANLHGAVVLGLLVLAIKAGSDLVQDRFDRRSWPQLALPALAALAICCNPYGPGYWRAYGLVQSEVFAGIDEWIPIYSTQLPMRPGILVRAALLAGLALSAWALNGQRRWAQLLWLVAFAALFVQARRNALPFALVCTMVLAANAQALDPERLWQKLARSLRSEQPADAKRLQSLLRWSVRLVALTWIGLECLSVGMSLQTWRPLGPATLEHGVVQFIRGQKLDGRLFNDYESSSYLQWSFAGHPALYIDGINAYPADVFRDYFEIIGVSERGRHLIDEQGIDLVVLTTNRVRQARSLAPLADWLDRDARWSRVHVSRSGVVWVRRTADTRWLWEPLADSVSAVKFSMLEEYGHEHEYLSQPLTDVDVGRSDGKK